MKLHRDLRSCISDGTLRHALLGQRAYFNTFNEVYNREYESKKALLQQAIDLGNWRGVIWLHDRPFRVQTLMKYASAMSDAEFWRMVGDVWIDAEDILAERRTWMRIWTTRRADRDQVMTSNEHRLLAKLPDGKVAIYRGYPTLSALDGLAWTYDKDLAMASGHPFLASATVHKNHIQAFFSGRRPARPDELVVLGRHCEILSTITVTPHAVAA